MARPKKSTAKKTTTKTTASSKQAETKAEEIAVTLEEVNSDIFETNSGDTKADTQLAFDAEIAVEPIAEDISSPEDKKSQKKSTAKKTTTKKEAVEVVYVQYLGSQISSAELIAKAKAESGIKNPKTVNVYVKPEDNKVYYVVDNNAGDFDLV